MSTNEKVNNYLSGLKESRIAMDQPLNEENCQDILGLGSEEDENVFVSECGPLIDFQKMEMNVCK